MLVNLQFYRSHMYLRIVRIEGNAHVCHLFLFTLFTRENEKEEKKEKKKGNVAKTNKSNSFVACQLVDFHKILRSVCHKARTWRV